MIYIVGPIFLILILTTLRAVNQTQSDTIEPSPCVFVIKGLTKHGLQRMTQRGVSKALAQKIINTGYAVAQGGGKVLYFTKEGVVVLTSAGQVVTAYSSAYFYEAMQAIVSLFYK